MSAEVKTLLSKLEDAERYACIFHSVIDELLDYLQ